MSADLIDVIVRFHDIERLDELQRCVFSLVGQRHRPLHVILALQRMGEGNVQRIRDVVGRLTHEDDGVHVTVVRWDRELPRDARSALMNLALDHVRGRFLAFLDYDDTLYPGAYETLVARLRQVSAGIVFASVRLLEVDVDGCVPYANRSLPPFGGAGVVDLFRSNFCPLHSYVLDRSRVDAECLRFDVSLEMEEDYEFLLRVCARTTSDFGLLGTLIGDYAFKTDGSNTLGREGNLEGGLDGDQLRRFEEVEARIERVRATTVLSREVLEQIGSTAAGATTIRRLLDTPGQPRAFPPLGPNPEVSCVLIFFDNEEFLEEAILSVLAQTYSNWDLVLVDDGSTDRSTEIARQYARDHPFRIRYFEHPDHQNRGMSAARDLGFMHARGALIAWLDGDDVWLPDKLAGQVAAFQRHPTAGMVYGHSLIWHSWKRDRGESEQDHTVGLGVAPDTLCHPPELALNLIGMRGQTPTTCNAIVRRQVIDTLGRFDRGYRDVFEDQAFFVKVELHYPVYVADKVWARYRQHEGSAFSRFRAAAQGDVRVGVSARLKLLRSIGAYVKQQRIRDARVRRELRDSKRALRQQLGPRAKVLRATWGRSCRVALRCGRWAIPPRLRGWLWQRWKG